MKIFCILFVMSIALTIGNQLIASPTAKAVRISTPPTIDGHINEAVWEQAFKIDQLFQREPNPGQAVSEKTIFFVCYDNNYLYFAVKCYGRPKKKLPLKKWPAM